MFEQILRDLYLVGSGNLTHSGDCQVYLVRTKKNNGVLIDAGADPSAGGIIDNLYALEVKPTHIILTHGHIDHIGGAHELKQTFNAEVIAHEKDAEVMESYDPMRSAAGYYGIRYPPVQVDTVISSDTTLTIQGMGFQIIEMPGHTPGSIAVFLEINNQRVLFGQDIHGPFNPVWGSNRMQHVRSLERLIRLESDILCEGHFGVIRPAARVQQYIQNYMK